MSSGGFLSRWSRLKTETQEKAPLPDVKAETVAPLEETQVAVPIETPDEEIQEQQDDVIADLPDVDSLTADSDFSVFMNRNVPEELQRLALRKLWRTNPVFANLDGLNDYDEDFSIITPLAEGLAEELKKLMKENSSSPPDENEVATEDVTSEEPTEEAEADASSEPDSDHDDDVGEGEDDF